MRTAGLPTSKLAAALGRVPDALDEISYCGVGEAGQREFRLLGHPLGRALKYSPLRLKRPAICSHCVAEHGYIDAFFDLSIVTACPYHRCTLVDHCSTCGEALSWFRPGLLTCKCGASLADVEIEQAPTELAELMAVLWALIHREAVKGGQAGLPARQLLNMPLRSLLLNLPYIGHWNRVDSDNENNADAITQAAAEALSDWPNGFHRVLRRIGHRSLADKSSAVYGFRKQFGQFYNQLFSNNSCGPDLSWLRDEFVRFGLMEWGESVVDPKLLRGDTTNARYVTKNELARQLDVSPATLLKWHRDGLLTLKEVPTKGDIRYVADTQSDGLQAPIPAEGSVLRMRAAAAYLRIPVSALNHLKATGLMEIRHRLKQRQGFHQADLDALRNRLIALSPVIQSDDLGDVVDLERILREYRFHTSALKAGFVAAYLAGEIQSIGRTDDTLAGIMFSAQAVATYVSDARSKEAGGSLTCQVVAKLIRSEPHVVASLQKLGYLDTVKGRESLRVSQESVDAFNARYASLSGLASELGSSSKRLLSLCNRGDLAVLSIPRSQGSPAPFIERENIATLQTLSQKFPARKPKAMDETRTVTAVKLYLTNLKALGAPLPRCGNKPNRRAIAMACGIDRGVFYNNQEISHLVDAYAASEDAGTDKPAPLLGTDALAHNPARLPLAA